MPERHRCAAQFIRMSTDVQDLSPAIQKQSIWNYAAGRIPDASEVLSIRSLRGR